MHLSSCSCSNIYLFILDVTERRYDWIYIEWIARDSIERLKRLANVPPMISSAASSEIMNTQNVLVSSHKGQRVGGVGKGMWLKKVPPLEGTLIQCSHGERLVVYLLLLLNAFVNTPYVKWMQLQCKQWIVVYIGLLRSSCPYPWLIMKENGC